MITPNLSYYCQSKLLMPRTQVQAVFLCGSTVPDPHSSSPFGLSARSAKHIRFLLLMGTPHPEAFPHCPHAYPPTSVYRICLFKLKAYRGTGSTCFSPRGNKHIHSPRKISMHKDVQKQETSPVTSLIDPAKSRERQAYFWGGGGSPFVLFVCFLFDFHCCFARNYGKTLDLHYFI